MFTRLVQKAPVRVPATVIASAFAVALPGFLAPPIIAQAARPALQSGRYVLMLTATTINGQPASTTPVLLEQVSVGWSGNTLSIVAAGQALRGAIGNDRLRVSSGDAGHMLTLSGTPSARSATGTFTLTQSHGPSASGGFTLTPQREQPATQRNDPHSSTRARGSPCAFWCRVAEWLE